MKAILRLFIPITILLTSCGNHGNEFLLGKWTVTNLSSVDSSMNKETLLNTFLAVNYSDRNILVFSTDNKLLMKNSDGKEAGRGEYKVAENGNAIDLKFPGDNMESHFKITNKTDNTISMTATDNGETINILMTKAEN
jgi:hypothetical protein